MQFFKQVKLSNHRRRWRRHFVKSIIVIIEKTPSSKVSDVRTVLILSIRSRWPTVKRIINDPFGHSFHLFIYLCINVHGVLAMLPSRTCAVFSCFISPFLFICICSDVRCHYQSLAVANKISDACATSVVIAPTMKKKNKYKDDVMRTIGLNWLNSNVILFVYFICTFSPLPAPTPGFGTDNWRIYRSSDDVKWFCSLHAKRVTHSWASERPYAVAFRFI